MTENEKDIVKQKAQEYLIKFGYLQEGEDW